MQVSIYRYDPAKDSAPYMQDVEVEIPRARTSWFLTSSSS